MTNYYAILGVRRDATPEEIKKEFRSLARRYHPDVNQGDVNAEEKFKQINEAYDILSDYHKRQQYDLQFLGTGKRVVNRGSGFTPPKNFQGFWDNISSANGGNKTRISSNPTRPVGDYSPGTNRVARAVTPPPRSLPKDIEAKLDLPLEKAFSGGRERIKLEDGRSIEVDMPSGMYHGQKIRLKGQGIRGGDLYLKILILPHPIFQLQGADISCEIPLTPAEAIVGGSIEVPTIDGLVKMNVPAGVKSGQRLKLANKGYPNIRGERGDQLIIIDVIVPSEVSEAEKKLYEQIREIEQFKPRQKLINYYDR
ncbi:DnaJ C-terminal domain-containing protein [Geminocystis herdmanii]|uniref:DnaJ C-terminal domain-containing protein n=1 Tax=Geminocystis herdmanii TaxID=669359 RepID=UPI000349F496|nr:J domain-containing protein [Geminocystis herdmanii]